MHKEKPTSRKEQSAETKRRLYETADKLFNECGVDNTSVEAIVKASGVSKGTFYVHFDSKEALIASLIADYVVKVDIDYINFLNSLPADTPVSDILLALTRKFVDVLEHGIGCEKMRSLYKLQLTRPSNTQLVMSYDREIYHILAEVLHKGILCGEFKASLPADFLAQQIMVSMRGLTYEWCFRYPDFNLQEQAQAHVKLLLSGIQR